MWLLTAALAAPVLTPPLAGVEDVDWTYAFGSDHALADGELRDWRGLRRRPRGTCGGESEGDGRNEDECASSDGHGPILGSRP